MNHVPGLFAAVLVAFVVLAYLHLPEAVEVAVFVDSGDPVLAAAEFSAGLPYLLLFVHFHAALLLARGEVAQLSAAFGFQPDEADVMQLGHRVRVASDAHSYCAVVETLDSRNVLFCQACVLSTHIVGWIHSFRFELGHFLTAAVRNRTAVLDLHDNVAANRAFVKYSSHNN